MKKLYVWNVRREEWESIELNETIAKKFKEIHELMHFLIQRFVTHPKLYALCAVISELTSNPVSISYVKEKLEDLFSCELEVK
jgi:hypothetical protein